MVDMIKALADENRFKIVELLSRGSLCVCEIEESLKLPQNLVSHHLSVLKESGLVEDCRCGKKNYYSLNRAVINKMVKVITRIGVKNED
jgi:ArsR family transcriptional regulator